MNDRLRHVLLVEDEDALRSTIALRLADEGFAVDEAATGEAALERLSTFAYDALITDLRLPGVDGSRVLDGALERYPDIAAIVVTGYGTVKDAVEAIRRGAADFITKPFQFDELRHVLRTALERRELRAENRYLREQLDARYGVEGLVGRSAPMRDLVALVATVAPTNSTILITGETGTGKEVVARAVHQASQRKHQRFIALNCSAIPESLLEAELFGHVRGAFTGAVAQRQGRFEQAHRGTLLLDEVGTMSPALQAKLLRVLQERSFERVGDSQTIRVDVRVIAATNSDLRRMVREGLFREDLYYRLNVIQIALPPLRERREDVPLLVQHFLDRLGRTSVPPRHGVTFSQEAMRHLMACDWPGNVRQLENVVERAFTLSPGRQQIDVGALPAELVQGAAAPPAIGWTLPEGGLQLDTVISGVERALILQALERTGGNRRQAADLLGLKRTTLVEKLKRLGQDTSSPAATTD
ncbi:MAG: sigma-54 dependent transcriptional regulator [Vicinamibacterales bacterium]|nr:sigma-54 dependent transcriptional regulator [Vicinamibacterales bacterium]